MHYWSELYKEVAEKITDNLPAIEWVDLWRDQASLSVSELPFDTPAVFIGFSTININDRGVLVQDCEIQIDLYLFCEMPLHAYSENNNQSLTFEYLNNLTLLHALFHGKSGNNYSSMRRVDICREKSNGSMNLYRISFQCYVTDYSAQTLFTETQNQDMELEVEKGKRPAIEDTLSLFNVE